MQGIGGGLRWEIEVEGHFAVGSGGIVSELEQLAPERGDGSFGGDRHPCRLNWY